MVVILWTGKRFVTEILVKILFIKMYVGTLKKKIRFRFNNLFNNR